MFLGSVKMKAIHDVDSMCRQIRKMKLNTKPKIKYYYKKKKKAKLIATFPGEIVQIDIKYIPNSCIGFISNHERCYQITAIDLYSRKRVMEIVNEKSTYSTMEFIKTLEENMGFPINTVQTDNGTEFCNDNGKLSGFQKGLMKLGIRHKRTAPYSPWQNGCVERSHREDERRFYRNRRFKSEEEMYTAFNRYANSYNNIFRRILNFKSPNEVVEEYFRKAA
jgi:transposase InsO family protein